MLECTRQEDQINSNQSWWHMNAKVNDVSESDVFSFPCIINQSTEKLRSILVLCSTFMINLPDILYVRTK